MPDSNTIIQLHIASGNRFFILSSFSFSFLLFEQIHIFIIQQMSSCISAIDSLNSIFQQVRWNLSEDVFHLFVFWRNIVVDLPGIHMRERERRARKRTHITVPRPYKLITSVRSTNAVIRLFFFFSSISFALDWAIFSPFNETDSAFVLSSYSRNLVFYNWFRRRFYFIFTTHILYNNNNKKKKGKKCNCSSKDTRSTALNILLVFLVFTLIFPFHESNMNDMSSDTDIDQDLSSSKLSSRRNYLIVPSFNPERRHSWGNVMSHPSQRTPIATSVLTIINKTDSILRWEILFPLVVLFFLSSLFCIFMIYNSRCVCVVMRLTFFRRNQEREKNSLKENREEK